MKHIYFVFVLSIVMTIAVPSRADFFGSSTLTVWSSGLVNGNVLGRTDPGDPFDAAGAYGQLKKGGLIVNEDGDSESPCLENILGWDCFVSKNVPKDNATSGMYCFFTDHDFCENSGITYNNLQEKYVCTAPGSDVSVSITNCVPLGQID